MKKLKISSNHNVLMLYLIGMITVSIGMAAQPKNVILFISDGCGYGQVDAANLYQYGETGKQVYEQFPVVLGISTYPEGDTGYDPESAQADTDYVKKNATDSAAAATALATGIKTENGRLGQDSKKADIKNVVEVMESAGKATGVVTSVQFAHATPAGFVAHNESRNNYAEIAREMIQESAVDVIMGCGHPYFDNNGRETHDQSFEYVGGSETWDLLVSGKAGGDANADGRPDPWFLIQERKGFQDLMSGESPDRLIGIPYCRSTLQQSRDGDDKADPYVVKTTENVPELYEMTQAALNVLDNDPDGFFLMVEGGAVDWASHGNQTGRMIEEEISFNRAVETAVKWVEENSNWNESLVIVTGDHDTGYLTGPDFGRLVSRGKGKMPEHIWHSGDHSNSIIPFFAKGTGSEFFLALAVGNDPLRGPYIDNTDIGKTLKWFYTVQ